MKLWATLLFTVQVFCQDPPDTTTKTETTATTTALPTTTTTQKTTPEPVVKCIVCEADSTVGENMDCFDGFGEEKDFGKDGACSYSYSRDEKNGETVYTVRRRGTEKRGDASEYPKKDVQEECMNLTVNFFCNHIQGSKYARTLAATIVMPKRGSASVI